MESGVCYVCLYIFVFMILFVFSYIQTCLYTYTKICVPLAQPSHSCKSYKYEKIYKYVCIYTHSCNIEDIYTHNIYTCKYGKVLHMDTCMHTHSVCVCVWERERDVVLILVSSLLWISADSSLKDEKKFFIASYM